MRELGIQYYASCNYWLNSTDAEDYLLRENKDVEPDDCDVVVVESSYIAVKGLPGTISSKKRRFIAVLIDNADGVRTLSHSKISRKFDIVLRTHYNVNDVYASDNVKPWAFGLSNRILRELETVSEWSERNKKILVSYGCMHPLRRRVVREVVPLLQAYFEVDDSVDEKSTEDEYHELMWRQTGRRHYLSYYHRLRNIAACAAFGGLTPPVWEVEPGLIKRLWRRRKEGYKKRVLLQWDSWRFWESLAAGAVTFHVDFEKYGLQLPVMPENGKHYIGVDMDNIDKSLAIVSDENRMKEISVAGREWAIENYPPVATAKRLLDFISQ